MLKNAYILIIFSLIFNSCTQNDMVGTEEEQIEAYISSKALVITEKSPSGLRFILTKTNATGAILKTGQMVTVNYAGRTLNDKQFDAGKFEFTLGVGQVVKGFDEGIAKLKVGEKGTLIFPSSLGYGSRGAGGDIGPNTPLLFDIEILSVR